MSDISLLFCVGRPRQKAYSKIFSKMDSWYNIINVVVLLGIYSIIT